MKKLILVTVIAGLTASSAASAATVYEKDGLTLDLKGDYQVQAYQPVGTDEDLGIDYDDLELKFGASYELENGMSAFGQLDLDWKDQGDGNDDDVVDEAYVGLKAGAFSTSLGRQYWGSDDFGVEKAIEMDGGNAFPTTGGNDTIKFKYDAGQYAATLSHDLEENNDESATDLLLTTKLGPAALGLVYQDYKANGSADSIQTTGVMASFDLGVSNVGLDYSTNDDADFINAAVDFPLTPQTKGAVGVTSESPDSGDDVLHWYANATHQLNSKVSVFAEIGDNDVDNTDMGYLAGMNVTF